VERRLGRSWVCVCCAVLRVAVSVFRAASKLNSPRSRVHLQCLLALDLDLHLRCASKSRPAGV
jgi:hypothetical protein